MIRNPSHASGLTKAEVEALLAGEWKEVPNLNLVEGTEVQEHRKLSYRREGATIRLEGALKGITESLKFGKRIATLPEGFRPAHAVTFPIACAGETGELGVFAQIHVKPNGEMIYWGPTEKAVKTLYMFAVSLSTT